MKLYGLALVGLVAACSAAVRPARLNEANTIAASAAAKQSQKLVPQAFAEAEKLRLEAVQAADEGKAPLADIKAERAIAAYARAQVLSRIVKAEQLTVSAKAELAQLEAATLSLEARRVTVAAELTSLDTQVQAVREAEVLVDPKASTPDREAARLRVAKSTLMQGRLLCAGASLQATDPKVVDADVQAIADLTSTLEKQPQPVPLMQAIRLRSRCQEQLTLARRPARLAAPNAELSDRLFVELSRTGHAPIRDERGIIVSKRLPVEAATISELAKTAMAFQSGTVLVVTHRQRNAPAAPEIAVGAAVERSLREAGVTSVRVVPAGDSLPIESELSGGSKAPQRVDFVFVTRT